MMYVGRIQTWSDHLGRHIARGAIYDSSRRRADTGNMARDFAFVEFTDANALEARLDELNEARGARMATTDRPEGYYWVMVGGREGEWEPAGWEDGKWWWVTGMGTPFTEASIIEVGERCERYTVTKLCAALETALDLMAGMMEPQEPASGVRLTEWLTRARVARDAASSKMAELRNVLARARGE